MQAVATHWYSTKGGSEGERERGGSQPCAKNTTESKFFCVGDGDGGGGGDGGSGSGGSGSGGSGSGGGGGSALFVFG